MSATRVLIVDDEPDMVENCARILGRGGLPVPHARRTRAGRWRCSRRERPDLLLTDLKMPGIDGMALLRRAHELDPALPVIVITAFATIESAVAAVKEGAFDYLPKNFSVEQLRVAVERALRHRRPPGREPEPPRAAAADVRAREHHRPQPGHGAGLRAGEEGGALGGQHPRAGRVRHRQGADRPRHPRQQPAGGAGLRPGRLRLAARAPARVRAVRPREGRLHRRGAHASRASWRWPTAARSSSTRSASCP